MMAVRNTTRDQEQKSVSPSFLFASISWPRLAAWKKLEAEACLRAALPDEAS